MISTLARKWHFSNMRDGHSYILQPLKCCVSVGLNFSNSSGDVHIGMEALVENITCDIEDIQVRNVAAFVHFIDTYLEANKLSEFRPDAAAAGAGSHSDSGSSRRDPAALWRFSIMAVRHQLGHSAHLHMSPCCWRGHVLMTINMLNAGVHCSFLCLCKRFSFSSELWKSILVNGDLASAKQEHSTQAFSQHSVNFVYNQLLALSKHRRSLRSGRIMLNNDDEPVFDLSYRQFTPVTDALLLQLEKRLNFESILIFRALAEVELDEDRKFNDPSWLKNFLFDTAQGLLGNGRGEEGGRTKDAKRKLRFILALLSARASASRDSPCEDNDDCGKPSDVPYRRDAEESHSSPTGLHLSVHIGIEAINLNLKLSPPSIPVQMGISAPSSSLRAFPFFTVKYRDLSLLVEADDQGRGIGAVPALTCDVSLGDAVFLQRSPAVLPHHSTSPCHSSGYSQSGPSSSDYDRQQCLIVVSRHMPPRQVASPLGPSATRLPFAVTPPVSGPVQQEEDCPLCLFSFQCKPDGGMSSKGKEGLSVSLKGATSAVDVFITPTTNHLLRAVNVFTKSLASEIKKPTSVPRRESTQGDGNASCRLEKDNAMNVFPDIDIKELFDQVSRGFGAILDFDSGVDLVADIRIAPLNLVFSSTSIPLEPAELLSSHLSPKKRHLADLRWKPLNGSKTSEICEEPAVVSRKLICSSGSFHLSMGEKKRKTSSSFDLYDIKVSEMQVFILECTCSTTDNDGHYCCSCCSCCWQMSADSGAHNILSPLSLIVKAKLQAEMMKDFTSLEAVRTATATFSHDLSDVSISISQYNVESLRNILDCYVEPVMEKSSVDTSVTLSLPDRGNLGNHKESDYFDVVDNFQISAQEGSIKGAGQKCDESSDGDCDDFYSLDSDGDTDSGEWLFTDTGIGCDVGNESQRMLLEEMRDSIMM
mmetsp:Transcript_8896/g.16685  ORF Transcript_8896/g.16685 Transcript_8896/m.16685 type:complete len:930 (-) Transcript_8896:1108-3897(-)